MATQQEVLQKMNDSAENAEKITKSYGEVLTADENTDIDLGDGTTTPSLSKRIKQLGGQVTSVNGKHGDVTIGAAELGLGSAAFRPTSDFVLSIEASKVVSDYSELSKIVANDGALAFVKNSGIAGEFRYDASSTENPDGGHVISSLGGGNWVRIAKTVNLSHYCIKIQTATTSQFTDYYTSLVAAITRAKKMVMPLVSDFPMFNDEHSTGSAGIYISQGIDISGLRDLVGNFTLFVKGSVFVPIIDLGTKTQWVLLNKNATYDSNGKQAYGSTMGRQNIGSISVVNLDSRSSNPDLNGQLHTTAHSNINGTLSAYKMGKNGIWLASTYDSTFNDIKVNQCGDTSAFAYDTIGYTAFSDRQDETNACTVNALMLHDSNDSALRLVGSKNSYVRIHEENTTVSTNNGGAPIYSSPYGYLNDYVDLTGGFIGQWQNDPPKSNPSHLYPTVSVIVMNDTTVGSLLSHEKLVVHSTNNPPNPLGGNIDTVSSNELFVINYAKASIGNCRVTAKTTTNYTLNGNVTVQDSLTNFDILQYSGDANLTSGVYKKVDGGTLSAGSSVIMRGSTTGNMSSIGGEVNNFTSGGSITISGSGSYKKLLTTNASSGTYTITGNPILENCTCETTANISNSGTNAGKLSDCYFKGNITIGDSANIVFDNVRSLGQLNLAGANLKFKAVNVSFANLSTYGTGYWTFSNCAFSTTAGNWMFGSDITTPMGMTSQNPSNRELYICTAAGWKQMSHA